MTRFLFSWQRLKSLLAPVMLVLALLALVNASAQAQNASGEITPSFGDGKLRILGAGFKPNENVTITVKIDGGTHTFTATANAQGEFQIDTGLAVAPGSSVELDARGDQGSGSASITSVPPLLPLPQTGAAASPFGAALLVGLLLMLGGIFLATRRAAS